MKFAHFADVHLGSWRDPKLSNASTEAFMKAVGICYQQNVDFIIISGDFFNTALPSIDCLKEVAKKLKEIKDKSIPVYAIAGSHDFSPTGKTMLDVLENAGLLVNVMRGSVVDNKLQLNFTVDEKTGAKITGVIGKKGMLERKYFESLDREKLEAESGFKIFMFHTAVSEFKPKGLEKMDSTPLSEFPKGFDYYAGGHVHEPYKREYGRGLIANAGPLFPNNFRELEKLGCGGFYIVEKKNILNADFQQIMVHGVFSISVDCSHKSAREVEAEIIEGISDKSFDNAIVTIRLEGALESGKPSEINFKSIYDMLYAKSAHFVMKNTAALTSSEFEEIKTVAQSVEETEEAVIKEHLGQFKAALPDDELLLTKSLMNALNTEKAEGETTAIFEGRVKEDASRILRVRM
ncbi:DNA repair exonuclease [Candidatus Woesearchaeota archaeon]|nr:DNA repair exonuclease [Candidatus Woesearchaeota archaeon]